MLSQLIRSVNRQTFKCIQSQNYVKRFYSNQDFNQKTVNEEKEYWDKYYHFINLNDWDETTKVYHEYYKKYYDNFKNKFDNKSSDRQTDNNNDNKYRYQKNNEKFNSNSYSFSECKYHLLTLRLLEKVGYIGAAIVVGLHFESPVYYSRQRAIINSCGPLEGKANDFDKSSEKVCGQCKYCSAILEKLRVLSAPIRSYVFSKSYKLSDNPKITEIPEEKNSDQSHDESTNEEISFRIKKAIEQPSDPIDEICLQLQTASIDYIDRLNNMLGIALIQTDPNEAMRCWRSTKTNSKALFNLGVAFERGLHSSDGVADLKQAFDHYILSASMGHKLAVYNLSLFYLSGKGGIVSVDHNKAEALLKKAAQMGVKPAEDYIKKLEEKRRLQMKPTLSMRSSASAPNLTIWNTCSESYNNQNLKKYSQNLSIANRV